MWLEYKNDLERERALHEVISATSIKYVNEFIMRATKHWNQRLISNNILTVSKTVDNIKY